ncbi:cytochrome c biogenesis CcdA family protein [Leifsonia sp. YAF41]|uniref:cytochrome c biogenesis CcdA family protein n=1 Tax=Leifsonia sp. YAF41 TaxID=3233086 RepID=UPI003F989F9D
MDIGYLGALLGGVLSLLSPCSVMLLPAFFAYAFTNPATLVGRTGVFYLGLVTTLVPLGILAGTIGAFLLRYQSELISVAAVLVIVLGLVQMLGISLPAVGRRDPADTGSTITVYVLGAAYGVAGVCTGPILGSVLTMAAVGANPTYGGILLAIYALGMTVPLLVLALVWKRIQRNRRAWVRPRMLRIGRWTNSWHAIVSGLLSLTLGVFLLLVGAEGFGGIVSTSAVFALESWVVDLGGSIPNVVVMIGALVVAGAVATIALRRRARASELPGSEEDRERDDSPASFVG